MLNEILIPFIVPLAGSTVVGIVGYIIFKNDQKNKNKAVDTRFNTMAKDVVQNDKRLRTEIADQNLRNDKMFNRLEAELIVIHNKQSEDSEKILATSLTMRNIKESVDDVSDKIDFVIKTMMEKSND